MKMRLPWLIYLVACCGGAVSYADDHGNTPDVATLISTGITATINYDTDQDWFKFLAAPSLVYTINVNNVTLWDNVFAIKAFAEGDDLRKTNSAFAVNTNSPSRIVWTNHGGLRHFYVGVSSLFEFTTGIYSVVISGNFADSDGDGMVDAWEMMHFGSLTNTPAGDFDSDGFSNWDEYVTGTDPANPASRLAVTNLISVASGSTLNWPVVPYGTYRVESSTNLSVSGWQFLDRRIRDGTAGSEQLLDLSPPSTVRHYRVIYEY
ncbi:MAG TPA: hypothetical protein PJ991_10625 [Kiritimatiellia bacterium]|nr:hypothetical protein [Kiritimatiellia bacterium]